MSHITHLQNKRKSLFFKDILCMKGITKSSVLVFFIFSIIVSMDEYRIGSKTRKVNGNEISLYRHTAAI